MMVGQDRPCRGQHNLGRGKGAIPSSCFSRREGKEIAVTLLTPIVPGTPVEAMPEGQAKASERR